MASTDTPQPAPAAAPLRLQQEPSRRGLLTGAILGVTAAAVAWRPELNEAAQLLWKSDVPVVAAPVNFAIAAVGGLLAAWVGWALDSWGKRIGILLAALALTATQSILTAQKLAVGWEPFSLASSLTVGLLVTALLTPRGAGVERWFAGRIGRVPLQRLTMAQSAAFLLPDQREAAVLTCRMLNEAVLREQMPAREFLRLMEAFRRTASSVLLEHGALLDAPESGAVRAFFGLPLAMENHADRAAVAALALTEAMKEFAVEQLHRERDPVECACGIACGTLTAGISGETYSAAGDAVEQSRWLAALNTDYSTHILTDGATHRIAENTEDRPLEILNPPEGAAVEVFHLLGMRGGLSQEALARRDAFRDAIILLRAGHASDALIRFADARDGLIHEDIVLERFVSQAEEQSARDQRKPPPPARPRARFSPRRVHRP
ncbi:MAG TPA: hypothetical protein VG796_15790 [Verrucomicrobiales bacterium]|nr:hypothetical protein [Verrucomicrobiales bacterium]